MLDITYTVGDGKSAACKELVIWSWDQATEPAGPFQFGGYGVDYSILVDTITTMDSKRIIKMLEADGWYLARVKGSHHQFKRHGKPGLVTVKHPDGEIPKGTLNSIKKQAGWK